MLHCMPPDRPDPVEPFPDPDPFPMEPDLPDEDE